LRTRIENVDHALVRLQLELLARLLVDVRRTEDCPALRLRRERNRAGDLRARLLRRPHDVGRGLIDHCMIECLEPNTDSACHSRFSESVGGGRRAMGGGRSRPSPITHHPSSYARIFVTTPAPTVRPPSRIANRTCSSIAIGVISSIVIWMLSPGITISV